jgi:Protein of unknown function (DUF1566)/TIR domain
MHKDGSLPKLFISYSKDDVGSKNTLLKHLAGLRNKFIPWNDQDMLPGEEWDKRIKDKLRSADVVLYLVSHNSIATDYIQNVELPLVIERCENNECVLIPVIVDFCKWQHLDFAKYNALPNKGQPVTSWTNRNKAWLNVVDGIERIIETVDSSVTQPSIIVQEQKSVDSSVIQTSIVVPEQKSVDSSLTQPSIVIPEPKFIVMPPVLKANEYWQVIDSYKVNEGLAIDTETGLMWLRFSYGQTWQNGTTQGQAQKVEWENAFKAAEDFNANGGYLGYNDWRLPTIDELKTLIDKVKGKTGNYIHPDVFPNNNGAVFWSCSFRSDNGSTAHCVDLSTGQNTWSNVKNNRLQVRLVRSVQ